LSHSVIEPPCEVQLLLHHHVTKCTLSTIPAIDEIWHLLTANRYLFTINHDTEIIFNRDHQTEKATLSQRGILSLHPNVTAISRIEILHATRDIIPRTLQRTYDEFDLPQPLDSYSHFQYHSKLQPVSLRQLNTQDLHILANDLDRQYEEIAHSFQPVVFLTTFSIYSFICYTIIFIIIFCFIYTCCRYYIPCLPPILTIFSLCRSQKTSPSHSPIPIQYHNSSPQPTVFFPKETFPEIIETPEILESTPLQTTKSHSSPKTIPKSNYRLRTRKSLFT